MNKKGNEFKGFFGGAWYDRLANLNGMGLPFYRKAVGNLDLPFAANVLELGCGTGSLSIAIAEKLDKDSAVYGVDISEDQLEYARYKTKDIPVLFHFLNASIDEVPFPDNSFDAVITSMALHETPPKVRRGAIKEASRVLKQNGYFILTDWSKPRFGLQSAFWLPMLFFGEWRDNWHNTYAELCREQNLIREEDDYITSLVRRQVFRKEIF